MSLKKLVAAHKVHTHKTSKQELDELRAVIQRDLSDASIPALSEDRRFATAYNAALQAAKMAIACAGYRVGAVPGHHAITFECAGLALGKKADLLLQFFDASRRKRNVIDYQNPLEFAPEPFDSRLKADPLRLREFAPEPFRGSDQKIR
jgi:hypothetical protein